MCLLLRNFALAALALMSASGSAFAAAKGVDRRSLKALLAQPSDTKLLSAMHRLQQETATSSSALHEVYVSGKTKLRLTALPGFLGAKQLEITENDQARPASIEDLRALGITSPAKFQALLRQRLRPFFKEWGYVLSHDYEALANTVDTEMARLDRHRYDLANHPDAKLLLNLRNGGLTHSDNPTGDNQLVLFDDGGDDKMVLYLGGNAFALPTLSMFDGDELRDVTFGDLTRLHLGTKGEVDAMLARHLVRISGVKGDANDARVVANARQVLSKQAHKMHSFASLVLNPTHTSSDFVDIISLMRSQRISPLLIRSSGTSSLNILWEHQYGSNYEFRFSIVKNGVDQNINHLRDFLPFNIKDAATFEAALAETLAKLEGKSRP